MKDKEFLEALAAQYWNQEVVQLDCFDNGYLVKPYNWFKYYQLEQFKYLELRRIESLTDEEIIIATSKLDPAKEFGEWDQMLEFKSNFKDFINIESYASTEMKMTCIISFYDYLRSISIAVPFRGITVEQMIEEGIVKLKEI